MSRPHRTLFPTGQPGRSEGSIGTFVALGGIVNPAGFFAALEMTDQGGYAA